MHRMQEFYIIFSGRVVFPATRSKSLLGKNFYIALFYLRLHSLRNITGDLTNKSIFKRYVSTSLYLCLYFFFFVFFFCFSSVLENSQDFLMSMKHAFVPTEACVTLVRIIKSRNRYNMYVHPR